MGGVMWRGVRGGVRGSGCLWGPVGGVLWVCLGGCVCGGVCHVCGAPVEGGQGGGGEVSEWGEAGSSVCVICVCV